MQLIIIIILVVNMVPMPERRERETFLSDTANFDSALVTFINSDHDWPYCCAVIT